MESLKIIPPASVTAAIARRRREQAALAARADELRSRATEMLHAIDARIGGCHYCRNWWLYDDRPGGPCACQPATQHNGVAHRSAADRRAPVFAEARPIVEIGAPTGRVLGVR